jgi:hypothetical protein
MMTTIVPVSLAKSLSLPPQVFACCVDPIDRTSSVDSFWMESVTRISGLNSRARRRIWSTSPSRDDADLRMPGAETFGADRDVLHAFLVGGPQGALAWSPVGAPGLVEHLPEQGRLASPGPAAQEVASAEDESAAQDAVEGFNARGEPPIVGDLDVGDGYDL